MLHHISLGVSSIEAAADFYDAVLGALGYRRVWTDLRPGERNQAVGYGLEEGKDLLALKERNSESLAAGHGFHLALHSPSRAAVDAFHVTALRLGALDQGEPKVWTEFGANYYAAYVLDPDGWQLEAVCNTAE